MMKREFQILRCAMSGVTAVEADTRHIFSRHTHEEFGIGVIHRGAQKSASGRGVVEAACGDTITVNPSEVHDGAPIGEESRAWRMLYFHPSVIAAATHDISEGQIASFEFCRPVIKSLNISARFQRLYAAVTQNHQHKTTPRSEELLLDLVPEVMLDRGGFDRARAIPPGVYVAKTLIDDDPTAPLTLSDLARASGLSRFQVLRGFARATGLTAHAYIVQRRIDLARRLIARACPLAEAAAASGFADQSHLTRTFVRRFGISPRAYANAVA